MQTTTLPQCDKLVELYYQPLFRFAARLVGSPDTALRLTQHTFRMALERSEFLPVPANVRQWLFTILFHEFLERRACARGV
jgi:DNA-directed RNA polymerase specialized sigma24 family protein